MISGYPSVERGSPLSISNNDYVLLRLLDAATGKTAEADYPALRADVHAALGITDSGDPDSDTYVSREAAHAEAVSETTKDALPTVAPITPAEQADLDEDAAEDAAPVTPADPAGSDAGPPADPNAGQTPPAA